MNKTDSKLSVMNRSNTHWVSVDILYKLPDEPFSRWQHGSLVVKLTGLQHRQQVSSPYHHVLTHAQQQALQLCTQLHRLAGNRWQHSGPCFKIGSVRERVQARDEGRWKVPGFEVEDNQRTNKESSPVSTRPSEDRGNNDMSFISAFIPLIRHLWVS